jgi:hypothetical protein
VNVPGYDVGPIDAKGAYTSDIELRPGLTPGLLSTLVEADRPTVVKMPGMRHKYLPMLYDPATGCVAGGGRYLFRTYENAVAFRDFLESCTMPGEPTTFWNRPLFADVARYAWQVFGAYDLMPLDLHDRNRFERYALPEEGAEARLPDLFPRILDAARQLNLAHVSLAWQPEHRLVGVVTAAAADGSLRRTMEELLPGLDEMSGRGSVADAILAPLGARKIFDRTSLNLTIYLPLSEQAGGPAACWPNSPPIPLPGVETLAGLAVGA